MRTYYPLLLLAVVLAWGCSKEQPVAIPDGGAARSGICPFELTIAVDGKATRERLPLKVVLKNTSEDAVGWDKQFSAYLVWRVNVEGAGENLEFKPVEPKGTARKMGTKKRFVRVQPGEKMSGLVDLAKGFQAFGFLPTVGLGQIQNEVAFEELRRLEVPAGAKAIVVRLEYWGLNPWAFEKLYGTGAADVGLWYGFAKSNEVRIDLK
jgi:hypothetical protein